MAARPASKRVPFIRRVSELPILCDRHWNTALLQMILLKPFRRFRMQAKQSPPRFMLSIFVSACAALLDNGNINTRRQFAHRRRKIDVLVFHGEAENAPAHAAAETMKRLALGTDRERWRLLLMKWTERFEVCARALQGKVRPDHLDDVVGGGNLLDGLSWDGRHASN